MIATFSPENVGLATEEHVLPFVHDQVGSQGESAQRPVANLPLRLRVVHTRAHTQRAVGALPRGEARSDALLRIVLV